MKLIWLGHACFLLEQDGYTILLDPYTGVEGYPPLFETAVRSANSQPPKDAVVIKSCRVHIHMDKPPKAPEENEEKIYVNKVLCSHRHHDHYAVELTALLPEEPCPFAIRTVETFHDGQNGALRGSNTVHILSAGGFTVAHLGDLGHQLSAEQAEDLGPLDALLIPVGGHYTIDAQEAKSVCEALKPRCVIPMHYHHTPYGLPIVAGVEDFLALWPSDQVRRLDSPSLELGSNAQGVIVPKFCEES